MNIVDLSSYLKYSPIFRDNSSFKAPHKIQTLGPFLENILLMQIFHTQCSWDVWGSDCVGGLAYYGKTSDIAQLENKILQYLENFKPNEIQCEYYALWNLKNEETLLVLYEDYSHEFPTQENVLMVKFGAWTDDVLLPEVLQEYLYLEDAQENDTWKVGTRIFSKSNTNDKMLLKNMKKAVELIHR